MKKGFENHHLLKNVQFVGEGTFQYSFNEANSQNLGMVIRNSKPYLFKKEDGKELKIKGEIYKVAIQDLEKLEFEGYTQTEIRVEVGEIHERKKFYAITFVANFKVVYSAEELLEEFKK
jgi:gamma-glutamylcyclotransferase (GGCT)/AIG2-like uncharacterized protein YtfP